MIQDRDYETRSLTAPGTDLIPNARASGVINSTHQWNISRLPDALTDISVFARSERARDMGNGD
jgi:hypothetical protein